MDAVQDRENIARNRHAEVLGKRLAVRIRAQILDVAGHACLRAEVMPARKRDILSTLIEIHAVGKDAAVEQAGISGLRKVIPEAAISKRCRLLPSAQRVVLGSDRQIGAAIDGPVKLLAQRESLR